MTILIPFRRAQNATIHRIEKSSEAQRRGVTLMVAPRSLFQINHIACPQRRYCVLNRSILVQIHGVQRNSCDSDKNHPLKKGISHIRHNRLLQVQ